MPTPKLPVILALGGRGEETLSGPGNTGQKCIYADLQLEKVLVEPLRALMDQPHRKHRIACGMSPRILFDAARVLRLAAHCTQFNSAISEGKNFVLMLREPEYQRSNSQSLF